MPVAAHQADKLTTGARVGLLFFLLLFVLFIYTFLHESGHALAGLLFGQSLTEFSINFLKWDAHVSMSGGGATPSQFAVQAMAGAALPLVIWVIFIRLVPRRAAFLLEALKLVSSMLVLNTLLVWIVIPIFYAYGNAPASDDVTHFLSYSRMPPALLTLVAGMAYVCGWAYFLSRIGGLKEEFLLFRSIDEGRLSTSLRTTLPWMAGILIISVISAWLLNRSAAGNSQAGLFPPPGFRVVAELDLSRRAYSEENLAEFTLDEPASAGVFIVVRNINTQYFDLRVLGPDGYQSVVLHGEGYRTERDGGLWVESLSPGTYRVVLTSEPSPGTASVFLRVP